MTKEEFDKLFAIGVSYTQKKDYPQAIKYFQQFLDNAPANDINYNNALLSIGLAHACTENDFEAIKYWEQHLDNAPKTDINYNDVLFFLGLAHSERSNYPDAIKYWEQYLDNALKTDKNYNMALYGIGFCYNECNEFYQAIKYWEQYLDNSPKTDTNYNPVLYNIGFCYNECNKYHQAIKYWEQYLSNALKDDKIGSNLYICISKAHLTLRQYKKAIESCEKAIKLDPNNSSAYNNKASALINLGAYKEAFKYYDKAIELEPDNIQYHNNKAFYLIHVGEYEHMREIYKEWAKEANKHYIEWVKLCINSNIVDYTSSMVIYRLQYLLLKENDKVSITEINERTKQYINKIVEFEHNKNKEKIEEYAIKNSDTKIILYKYSSYDKNAIYNIKKEQMYFSDPSKFNDPFDPLIRVLDKEHSDGLVKLLNFRASCLSPKPDNLLLWSHYADKHQGICIAYDITKLVKHDTIIFRKVEHIPTFQKPKGGYMFGSLNTVNKTETLINTFTQKQKVWDYEEEYRLILQTDKEDEFLQQVDIKEIYLGRNMPDEDKKFIKDMVDEMNINREKGKENIKVFPMDVSDDDIFQLKPMSEN